MNNAFVCAIQVVTFDGSSNILKIGNQILLLQARAVVLCSTVTALMICFIATLEARPRIGYFLTKSFNTPVSGFFHNKDSIMSARSQKSATVGQSASSRIVF
jgi:hypothetical protein